MMDSIPEGWVDRYFEDIEVGETHTLEQARTITEADIVNFAGVTGDFSPIHVSRSSGEETPYGQRIAHGNLVANITEALVVEKNIQGIASYGHDNTRFVNPVFIDDTITAHREVVDKDDVNDKTAKVIYRYTTENQNGKVVCVDDHITLIKKRPE
jgi:acyl dehydratase